MAKKPYLERVVTADGYAPFLFYLMLTIATILAGYLLHFWVVFGMRLHLWAGL